jgi:hypothetical protein
MIKRDFGVLGEIKDFFDLNLNEIFSWMIVFLRFLIDFGGFFEDFSSKEKSFEFFEVF